MPDLEPAHLRDLARRLFEAAGTPGDIARHVADHLVGANLAGHDSHGVIRLPTYLDEIRRGALQPQARPRIIRDRPAAALFSGEWGFGQPAASAAMAAACERAQAAGLGAAGLIRANHIGRLGTYTEQAAARGLVGLLWLGGLGDRYMAIPFGGRRGVYSTNPMSFAFPTGDGAPLLLDYATTTVARGKVLVARDRGERLPEGAIVDREGRPSTDPEDLLDGGSLLSFGAHKGYALAFFVQLLGQALTGGDTTAGEEPDHGSYRQSGAFFLAADPGLLRPADEALSAAQRFAEEVRGLPPAPGFERVLAPGDPEARSRREREGAIPVPDATWRQITAEAAALDVAM